MTREEYDKKYTELSAQARAIAAKKVELEKEYLDSLPFKVGNKVEMTDRHDTTYKKIGWIVSMHTSIYDGIEVTYNPPKKNGERSENLRKESTYFDCIKVINDE